MSKNTPKRAIDISGTELMPGEPSVCLGNGEQDLSVAAMNVITICAVFPNPIKMAEERVS